MTSDRFRTTDPFLRRVFSGEEFLVFDGAMGTMLQEAGLKAGELPELLNFSHPETVTAIHRAYVEAGADVISANTFGANAHKLGDVASVEDVFAAGIACARQSGASYVAADIGPIGALLKPLGTMDFDEAYDLFAQQARAAQAAGADLFVVETMTDLLEAKAAVLACLECTELPVVATMTFGEDGCTFLGTSPEICAMTLSALGVQAVGINCSLGPDALAPLLARMAPFARVPLMVQANAGLPRIEGGRTLYDIDAEAYAHAAEALLDAGATIVCGCCGTSPDYIARIRALVNMRTPVPPQARDAHAFAVCSAQKTLVMQAGKPCANVIGERINPTGKKRLKEALRSGDFDYAVGEALDQAELGADALDVNVGLPELDEPRVLVEVMERIQAVCDLPLQIDSSDPEAVRRAVRRYAGKALINSVNGKAESLEAVLPIAAHYGCAVVGLTLDENGIPETAEGRLAVARRIVQAAEEAGIPREDVVIDCLAMAASTNQMQVAQILRAMRLVHEELGVRCVLGVSNISFGLPQREMVNSVFLAQAFASGLDLAIMNPKSRRMCDVVATQRVLNAQDEGAAAFIERYAQAPNPYDPPALAQGGFAADVQVSEAGAAGVSAKDARVDGAAGSGATTGAGASQAAAGGACDGADALSRARHLILTGRKAQMEAVTRELLASRDALEVIDGCFIPVLDEVGAKFERGELFLPQLMASAEAVKVGFDTVKACVPAGAAQDKGDIVLATVKGDIHDIGKNIVKMLLENYGYRVHDLGRDVAPEAVLECVRATGARLVGLSALMTTTVRSMEQTVELLHREAPGVKVMVGGAVLTPEYAATMGAEYYAKDAAESARIAGEFFAGK